MKPLLKKKTMIRLFLLCIFSFTQLHLHFSNANAATKATKHAPLYRQQSSAPDGQKLQFRPSHPKNAAIQCSHALTRTSFLQTRNTLIDSRHYAEFMIAIKGYNAQHPQENISYPSPNQTIIPQILHERINSQAPFLEDGPNTELTNEEEPHPFLIVENLKGEMRDIHLLAFISWVRNQLSKNGTALIRGFTSKEIKEIQRMQESLSPEASINKDLEFTWFESDDWIEVLRPIENSSETFRPEGGNFPAPPQRLETTRVRTYLLLLRKRN